MLRESVTANIL